MLDNPIHPLVFTICRTPDDEFYFRLRSPTDKVLMTSGNYFEFRFCIYDVHCMQNFHDHAILLESTSDQGRHYFKMRELGGRVLARSSYYQSFEDIHEDIQLVQLHICHSTVVDLSMSIKFFRPVRINK